DMEAYRADHMEDRVAGVVRSAGRMGRVGGGGRAGGRLGGKCMGGRFGWGLGAGVVVWLGTVVGVFLGLTGLGVPPVDGSLGCPYSPISRGESLGQCGSDIDKSSHSVIRILSVHVQRNQADMILRGISLYYISARPVYRKTDNTYR